MKSNLIVNGLQLTYMLSEEFSFADNTLFRTIIDEISSSDCSGVDLDMRGVTSIDSAGLGMLMLAFEASSKEQIPFRIMRPQGQVNKMLEVSDFAKIMKIES